MKATRSLLCRINLFPDLKQKAGDEGYKEQDCHKFLRDPPVPLSHGCVRPSDWSYFELLPFDKALPNTGYEVTMYCPLQVPSTAWQIRWKSCLIRVSNWAKVSDTNERAFPLFMGPQMCFYEK